MSGSKRRHEGYFLTDHRDAPGLPEDAMINRGLPAKAGQGLFEAPTYTCSHCQTVVIINPDRTRERTWCRKCDHYICDRCGAILATTGVCKTFQQLIDETQELALKREGTDDG